MNSPAQPADVHTTDAKTLSLRATLREMAAGAVRGRYLAWRLFRRENKSEVSSSFFGYLWYFADPLILALVFVLLRRGGVIEAEGMQMPYGVYVVFGMLLLQVFLDSLARPVGLIERHSHLVTQVKVPPESLLMAQLLHQLFMASFTIPILLFVAVVLDAFSPVGFLIFLLLFPVMVLLGFSISVLLAPLNAIYNDVQNVIRSLNRPLLFLCPTFYYAGRDDSVLGVINQYNPIAIVMDNLRLIATSGQWHSPVSLLLVAVGAAVVLAGGALFFHLAIPILAERV